MNRRQLIGGAIALAGASNLGLPRMAKAQTAQSPAIFHPQLHARLQDCLGRYASFGSKLSGSKGDLASARWIAEDLRASGYTVEQQEFGVPTFAPSTACIQTSTGRTPVDPQPVVVQTPAAGITARGVMVYDTFDAAAANGAIALVMLPFARHAAIFSPYIKDLIDASVRAGALAIVLVTTGPTDLAIGLNTRLEPMAPVPISLLAPRDLPQVKAAVARRERITLMQTGRNDTGTSVNVVATRHAGPKWLAFSTPRSGWGQCVGERAPGTAIFLELCRWAATRFPDLSIHAINTGGHELDFIGTHHALGTGPNPDHTLLWTHLGAGLATLNRMDLRMDQGRIMPNPDPQRVMMVSPAMMDIARKAFAGLAGYDNPVEVVGGAGELSTIIDEGYRNAFAGLGVHRWLHTEDDSIDVVNAEILLPVHLAHQQVVEDVVGRNSLS